MNTPGQIALYEAFGYQPPAFAHLPIIFNMNGTKMSKREKDKVVREAAKAAGLSDADGLQRAGLAEPDRYAAWKKGDSQLPADALHRLAASLGVHPPEIDIHDFRVSGYLPEVLLNFIALLGWSPGENREKFTLSELCEAFSLERVGKTNARFDRDKLLAFNTTAIEAASPDRKLAAFKDWLSVSDPGPFTALDDSVLARLIETCKGFRTFPDIEKKAGSLFVPDESIKYDEKAVKKWLLKDNAAGLTVVRELRERLASLDDWSPPALDALVRSYADSHSLELGKTAQPLRVALTGSTISPQIADTLALLGKQRTLARIDRCLKLSMVDSAGP